MACHQAQCDGNFKARYRRSGPATAACGRIFTTFHQKGKWLLASSVIDFMLGRLSPPIQELAAPAPSDDEIATMIKVAAHVPDHGRMTPWRFILYRGEARIEIGERLAALAAEREGPLNEVRLDKERTRFSRAPLVIGVVSSPRENPKIPDWEMTLSGGAAAMSLVFAANALGYASNWITNWYAYDEEGRRILGLAPHERVIGFVHIGTFRGTVTDRRRPDAAAIAADYAGPWEA